MRTRLIHSIALVGALLSCIYQASAADDPGALFVMRIDGSDVRRVADVVGYRDLSAARWSHDGKWLAFDAQGIFVESRRWFLVKADGSGLREMGAGSYADWSPDDKQLVFAVADQPVAKGLTVQNADGRGRMSLTDDGQAPRWSPSGNDIALLNAGSLEIMDLTEGQRRAIAAPKGIAAGYNWSPDGALVAAVVREGDDAGVWIIDVADPQKNKKRLAGKFDGNLAWSPDGKRLAVVRNGKVHLLAADGTGKASPIVDQEGISSMPAWSPDGEQLAFVSTRRTPARAPVARAARRVQFTEAKQHTRGNVVYGMDLTPDGRQVLSGGKKDLEIWDINKDEATRVSLKGEWVALAPDGRTVALSGPLIKITLADIETGKVLRDLSVGTMCTNVRFSPSGKQLVTGTIERQAYVYEVASGKRTATFDKHNAPITRVAYLPSGDEVASNGQDKVLRIWNPNNAQERLAIPHPEVAWGLAVSPDGRSIATGTGGATEGNPIMHRIAPVQDYVVRLWDAANGNLIRELKAHTDIVYSLAFSPDGRTLASGGWDGAIYLWDVATGLQLGATRGQGSIHALLFTPDGNKLIAAGGENRTLGRPIRRYPGEQLRVYQIVEETAAP